MLLRELCSLLKTEKAGNSYRKSHRLCRVSSLLTKNISVAPSLSELDRDMGAKPNDDFLTFEVTEKYRNGTSSLATKIRSKLTPIRQILEIKGDRTSNHHMWRQNNQLKVVPVLKRPD
jgi:hypothetical protein